MFKHAVSSLALFSMLLTAPMAQAQEEEEEAAATPTPAPKPVAKPKQDNAASGVADVVGYKFPRGIYTTADLGVFWRYLGFADSGGTSQCFRCRYPTYYLSNAQPFIGISVGYDILPTIFDYIPSLKVPDIAKRFGVSGQFSLGTGYVANAAPWSIARSAKAGSATCPEESLKDHAILSAHPCFLFNFVPPPFERVVLEARLFAGLAAFTPSVQRFQKGFADPNWWMGTFGANVGFGLGIKYMTLLTNFVIGSDLAFYHIISPGYATEIIIPPTGRIAATNCVPSFAGFCPGPGKPNVLLPLTVATSFSPIIIKYVF